MSSTGAAIRRVFPWAQRRWAAAALLLGVPLLGLGLYVRPVAETPILAELDLSAVSFRLVEPRTIFGTVAAERLGLTGLAHADLPPPGPGAEPPRGSDFAIELAALSPDAAGPAGPGQLSLSELRLPASTRLDVELAPHPRSVRITFAGSPVNLAVTRRGTVRRSFADGATTTEEWPIPELLTLTTGSGPVQLDLTLPEGGSLPFRPHLPVDELRLSRILEEGRERGTAVRQVSTLLGGRLELEELERERPLEPGDRLVLTGVDGEIQELRLAGERMRLIFRGTVSGLTTGTAGYQRDLMPTWLERLRRHRLFWAFLGAVVWLLGVVYPLLKWSKGGA